MEFCAECGGQIIGTIHFIAPHLWMPHAAVQEMIDTNAPLPFLCESCARQIVRASKPVGAPW